MSKAVFLDRDGTIIEDRGHIDSIDEVEFFPFTIQALKILQKEFMLFIATNQSGIGQGKITREAVNRVNLHIMSRLESYGVTIQQIYCCPHKKDDQCRCMKPDPFFIMEAQALYEFDLSETYSIGDHPHDVSFAESAGGKGLYVLTGHGRKHLTEVKPGTLCFENLLDAACWIMKKPVLRFK